MVDSIIMDQIIGPDLSTNVSECFYDQGGDFWSIRNLNDLSKIWICCISGGVAQKSYVQTHIEWYLMF